MSDLKYYSEEQLLDELKSRLAAKKDDDLSLVMPTIYWNPVLHAAQRFMKTVVEGKSTEGQAVQIFETVMIAVYGSDVMKWLAKRGFGLHPTVGGTHAGTD